MFVCCAQNEVETQIIHIEDTVLFHPEPCRAKAGLRLGGATTVPFSVVVLEYRVEPLTSD
jgi:hypothetical protein